MNAALNGNKLTLTSHTLEGMSYDLSLTEWNIGEDAFVKNENRINHPNQHQLWDIRSGVLHNCYASASQLILPDEIHTIARRAFENADAEYICVPRHVALRLGAFESSKFKEITLPEGITRIEDQTFLGCKNLYKVKGTDSLTYIGRLAFAGCKKITQWKTNQLMDMIDENAFAESGLTSLQLNCRLIGRKAFANCASLEEAVLENTIVIDDAAFAKCISLNKLQLKEPLLRIGDHTFRECKNLISVVLPQSLQECGYKSFADIQNLHVKAPEHLRILLEDEHMVGRPENDFKDQYYEGCHRVFDHSANIQYT